MSRVGNDPVRDPSSLGFDKTRLARLKAWMQRYTDSGRWPGGAVLIARLIEKSGIRGLAVAPKAAMPETICRRLGSSSL